MNRSSPPLPLLIVAALAALAVTVGCAAAQPAADPATDSGLTCEVYCSETKLRTANARISWIGPGAVAAGPEAAAAELLQTTVYKNGFAQDLYASFPTLGSGQEMAPEAAEALPEPEMRAYDLAILEVARPAASGPQAAGADDPGARTSVEVEGLEPGMRYTWRIVFETADGQASETVTCEAPVCPADLQEENP